MARRLRVEKIGYYHIINRGVAKNTIFYDRQDFIKFLEICNEASDEYGFKIFSYCLMNNHYHLLLKTNQKNLSILMQKINSRYSIYFNHKYKRVGPLWQGRFKSWFVYDEIYLQTLVKYIEYNPIKANITKIIGKYEWAMSSRKNIEFSMLNFELLDKIKLDKDFSEKEQKKLDEFLAKKIEIKENKLIIKDKKELKEYFKIYDKEKAIFEAVKDGYTQSAIASYLNLSYVSISKRLKTYKQKLKLFEKLKQKGLLWSYSKDMKYNENLTIEHTLKYGDFDDIILAIKLFGKRKVKTIWQKTMQDDKRFIKLNVMIARVFFDMNVDGDYFKRLKNGRLEKLKLLAS